LESIISLVTNKLVTTILLLALALLAKKYRLLLREVLRERFLREVKKGCFAAYYLAHYFLRTKKSLCSLRSLVRSSVLRIFQWIPAWIPTEWIPNITINLFIKLKSY